MNPLNCQRGYKKNQISHRPIKLSDYTNQKKAVTPAIPQNTTSQIEVISSLWETQVPKTTNQCICKFGKHPNGQNQLKFVAH